MLSEVLKPKSIRSYIFFLISHSSISLLSFKCFSYSSIFSEKTSAFSMTIIFNNHFDLIMSRQKKKIKTSVTTADPHPPRSPAPGKGSEILLG